MSFDDIESSPSEAEGIKNHEGDIYNKAVAIVLRDKKTSISYIQRQLRIGYNKSANLIERMEQEGILSGPNSAGKREIIKDVS